MKHIVSFSGGKDSTAMLLMMIEKGMQIDDVVFCDTGAEFPQMYEHIKRVEDFIGMPITVVKAEHDYFFYLTEYEITRGKRKGEHGYGHPDFRNRWCTAGLKRNPIKKYLRQFKDVEIIEYHGIAKDEEHRTSNNKSDKRNIKYPLVDWGITETQALQYCYDKGFDFGGLYKQFSRVSCWCCPLSRIGELRTLYHEYPELWEKLKLVDGKSYRRFRSDYSVQQLEDKFNSENRRHKRQ